MYLNKLTKVLVVYEVLTKPCLRRVSSSKNLLKKFFTYLNFFRYSLGSTCLNEKF